MMRSLPNAMLGVLPFLMCKKETVGGRREDLVPEMFVGYNENGRGETGFNC